MQIGNGFVVVCDRDEIGLAQFRGALGIELRQLLSGFGVGEIGLRLLHGCSIGRRLQLSNHLALRDGGIEVDIKAFDHPGNLAADLHAEHGIELAAGGYGLGDVAARDLGGPVFEGFFARLLKIVPTEKSKHPETDQKHDPNHPFHSIFLQPSNPTIK